jgi:hypothetical protein
MIYGILEENSGRFEYDDIGFIIIDPYRTERIAGTTVIMGGTRPYEEQQYLSQCASGLHDRWVPDGQWSEHDEVFVWAGIKAVVQKLES